MKDTVMRDVPAKTINGHKSVGFMYNNEIRCQGSMLYKFWNIYVNFEI